VRKLRGGKSIRTVVNDGRWRRQGGGLHSNEIQRSGRNRKRPDRQGPEERRRGETGEARVSTVRTLASAHSSVFLFTEDSHKVLCTESYPILSPGSLRSRAGISQEREREREGGGRFSHSGGPFIETNGLVRLFLLVPSSSLSSFIPRLPYLHDLPVSVLVRSLPLPPLPCPLTIP